MKNIVPHYNPYSRPYWRIQKPCLGCGGLTRINEIAVTCLGCWGQGWVEDYWEPWNDRLVSCGQCRSDGRVFLHLRYCCQECADVHFEN